MKLHKILVSFPGNQTGNDREPTQFVAGTEALLSDDLAAIAVKQGWAVLAQPKAETRETKVIEPEEAKVEEVVEVKAETKKKRK